MTELPRIEDSLRPFNGKRVVVLGAGFGGLAIAKKLSRHKVQVVIIDKNNYHTFQPLLYQVATGGLEPDSIAYPVRRVFRRRHNVTFRMARFQEVQVDRRQVVTSIGTLGYDYLVIATGSKTNFYSLHEVEGSLMPLKTLTHALNLRSFIMQNLERASLTPDKESQQELINVSIVGAGPTGVELAGALAEMRKHVLPKDFPELNLNRMHIYLIEAADRPLPMMSAHASRKTTEYLKKLGVILNTNTKVIAYDGRELSVENGSPMFSETVIWTAGVKIPPVAGLPASCVSPTGRIRIDAYLRVIGLRGVYAIGDVAEHLDDDNPKGHPMLAPVAMQQGRTAAGNIVAEIAEKELTAFEYKDKGVMATIGRNRAVADLKRVKLGGTMAWLAWMLIHIYALVGFRNKLITFIGWVYNYFTFDRALGLIIRPYRRK
jgi:NADH dehydrogenase